MSWPDDLRRELDRRGVLYIPSEPAPRDDIDAQIEDRIMAEIGRCLLDPVGPGDDTVMPVILRDSGVG